jgi:Holliday junction resolvasome RuvABC endonuclease subunit
MPQLEPNSLFNLDYYMGIDPGQSGGIALIRGTGKVLILETMPSTERDIWLLLKSLEELPHKVYIEKVHAMPQQGVSSTFKFGVGYGGLRMALTAAGIPFDEVTPQLWQKALGVVKRAKTESKNDHKKKLLQKAQQLFPNVKITLKTADALLLAEYCRRVCMGVK